MVELQHWFIQEFKKTKSFYTALDNIMTDRVLGHLFDFHLVQVSCTT
jgi:hypothetical protein